MRFYSYFIGCQGKEKKGHLWVLLLYCFILLLPLFFFFFSPVSLVYSPWACGSWCCLCADLSGMTFGNACISSHCKYLFAICPAANSALPLLSEVSHIHPLISVISYWPSPISPVPLPCWLLFLFHPCLSGIMGPGSTPSLLYITLFFSSWKEELYSDPWTSLQDAFNGWPGCQVFESDVGGMFLASLNKYQKAGICSKCSGSWLAEVAAACPQELWN